jgi:two-component system sensor histidine kinase UhpB
LRNSARGRISGVVGVALDVTDQRRTERALRESEERLQLVARATNDVLWDWDLVTNAVWWGTGIETLFWYGREEIEPGIEGWTSRVHPDDRERVLASVHEAIDSGRASWSGEYRFRRHDGSYADVFDRGYVIHDPDRRPVRMVGSMMDVSDRKRSEGQLQASRAALRLLATRHQDVREDERTRIAREIHDSLGQSLTALKLSLAAAHDAAARGAPGLPERLSETANMVDDLVKGVRRIATELRPPVLDQLGLPAAIEWLARDFTHRTGIPCCAEVVPSGATISGELATALFRIVQEALTNIVRHADATRATITLDVTPELVTLEVTDNGRGITEAAASAPTSLGILGMRERAAAQGGVLEVGLRSEPGTRVSAWFPMLRSRPSPSPQPAVA